MRLSEFDFEVPEELVAQRPLEERDAARMLVLDRRSGRIEHRRFRDLPELISPRDFLVFNSSRVTKARLLGERATGGKVEIFLLRRISEARYECLMKATAAQKVGLTVRFGDSLTAEVLGPTENPMIHQIELRAAEGSVDFWIERYGRVPLPPYIKRKADGLDISRYQTIYAADPGSVAAPTAGLHFTEETFRQLRERGIESGYVTLHVGLGTFQPIKADEIEQHVMHEEEFHVPEALQARCGAARAHGENVVAIGTTAVRALESAARGKSDRTDLFLRPGEKFLWVDKLFTNFHQPKSSLVVMLTAFVGERELLMEAYRKAVEEKYRFFSYGDCMLVL